MEDGEMQKAYGATTDSAGHFSITDMPPGAYNRHGAAIWFRPAVDSRHDALQ
jgi:hypothetical protein